MTTTDSLTGQLAAAGALTGQWRVVFEAVRREWFIPARMWVDDQDGRPVALDRDTDPAGWHSAVGSDRPILTQFDDGQTRWPATTGVHCTCSASQPGLVLAMLDALDPRPGQRVLEIGAGTGYNAALLAARIGAGNVTTVEVDPGLAAAARTALHEHGFPVEVICADGATGHPPGAPFDRIIATAAVRLGELPAAWVEQTRPGGVIVTPVRPDIDGAGALVRYVVDTAGRASGRPVGPVAFMPLREHRARTPDVPELVAAAGSARESSTRLRPWRLLGTWEARWAIGARVAGCRWRHDPPDTAGGAHVLWLTDPESGSWATVRYEGSPGPRPVQQAGPRDLWDEIEAAFREWKANGKPPPHAWTLTVAPSRQHAQPLETQTGTG